MQAEQSQGQFITQEQVKAVNVLLAAASVAQKNGAFSLADASHVFDAVSAFAPPPAPEAETPAEEESSD